MSDSLGNYSIVVNDMNGSLRFTIIGFAEKEIAVDGRSNINVVLEEDIVNLNEVVVPTKETSTQSNLNKLFLKNQKESGLGLV